MTGTEAEGVTAASGRPVTGAASSPWSGRPVTAASGGPALPPGLPRPQAAVDGLEAPHWEGTRRHELLIQRCRDCGTWQWGPEWLCHRCRSWAVGWEAVAPAGRLYAWERVWHPTHPALRDAVPYRVALVELPQAGGVRVLGTLLGDPAVDVEIGAAVEAVFEDHDDVQPPYTLVQWRAIDARA